MMTSKSAWLILVAITPLVAGCQSIEFYADLAPLVTTADLGESAEPFVHEEKVHFFLWGFVPDPAEVNLTDIAFEHGATKGMSNVSIHEEGTFVDSLIGLVTVWIYKPRTFVVTGVPIQ